MSLKESNYIGGFHAVLTLLRSGAERVSEVCLLSGRKEGRGELVIALAQQHRIPLRFCSRLELDNLFNDTLNHQGVAVRCETMSAFDESFLSVLVEQTTESLLLLILDGVQDPHNLGACLRTANGFGANAVVVPKDRACGLTPTVCKVACGAANLTPLVAVTNLSRTLKSLQAQQVWLVGMTGESDTQLSEIDLTGHIGIVMGSEGQGMRRLTQRCCDYSAKIPMKGGVQSFNVGIAAAISLYEAVRQRY